MPKVSVIVPVYGVELYIERCVRSLFEQTLKDIEYLFIDDCSPDKSIEVLLSVLNEFPERKTQVLIHRMTENSGQAKVREWGMCHATGDFIIHCDSDDWLEPDAYSIMYNTAIEAGSDIVVCDFLICGRDGTSRVFKGYTANNKEDYLKKLLIQKNSWSLCNKLFRRQARYGDGLIFPKGNMGEDMVLAFQMLLNGGTISYIPQPLYVYCLNPSSITHSQTIEQRIKNFYHNKENADILFNIFYQRGITNKLAKGVEYVKWKIKQQLWDIPRGHEKHSLWKETYKEVNLSLLFNTHIPPMDRLKCLLLYLGI